VVLAYRNKDSLVAVVALLNVHPSREADLRETDPLRVEPTAETQQ
jgi:hypothetical protein